MEDATLIARPRRRVSEHLLGQDTLGQDVDAAAPLKKNTIR